KLGPLVPRGFLSVLDGSMARGPANGDRIPKSKVLSPFANPPKIKPKQSGRVQLAPWLPSTQNPLTPAVMANRIWQPLFCQGLVSSVDNFGVTGDVPSHPELLDHLAATFVRDGWSVKKLVRALVLSRAYQLGSEAPAEHVALDPANRLVWRHSPRRLE